MSNRDEHTILPAAAARHQGGGGGDDDAPPASACAQRRRVRRRERSGQRHWCKTVEWGVLEVAPSRRVRRVTLEAREFRVKREHERQGKS